MLPDNSVSGDRCNVCLADQCSTSLTKMQQKSGKAARNIVSGNKILKIMCLNL